MKKLTALILCLAVMLSCAATVFADGLTAITVTPEVTEAAPGDTIDFTVTIEAAEDCRTLGLMLKYDAAVFEVVDGQCAKTKALVSTFDPDRGFIFLFATAVKLDGEICTFTLKVRDAAPAGTYEVNLKASMKDTGDPLDTEISPASVTVVREEATIPKPDPTDAPKETQPPKQTESPEVTEVTEAPEVTEVPTEAQPTEPEIPGETPVPETQTPTQAPLSTEPVFTTVPKEEFRFPLWAIAVYAAGILVIIVILILKRRQK